MRYYFRFRTAVDLATAILAGGLVYARPETIQVFRELTSGGRETFGLAMFGTAASLLGFVLTASTFLTAILQDSRFDIIRNAKSFQELPELVASTLWRLFALMGGGLSLVFVDPAFSRLAEAATGFLTTWSFSALAALVWVVTKIYALPPHKS